MNKPEDIPQDVWDIAQAVESDCINATWNGEAKGTRTVSETIIARAIMAAKAEEREACALLAEERHRIWGTQAQTSGIEVEDDLSACWEIAAAIRKRGEG